MNEYIDRKALLKDVQKIGGSPWSEWETAGVFNVIRKQPVVDAVKVVRCGECIHRRSMNQRCIGRRPDWFCANGERREDHEID